MHKQVRRNVHRCVNDSYGRDEKEGKTVKTVQLFVKPAKSCQKWLNSGKNRGGNRPKLQIHG